LEHRYSLQTWIDAEVEEEELIGNDSSTAFPVKPAEHTQQLSSSLHPVEVERENFDPPTKRIKLSPAVPIEKAATFVASTALDEFMRLPTSRLQKNGYVALCTCAPYLVSERAVSSRSH
jgi:hypothetical protein